MSFFIAAMMTSSYGLYSGFLKKSVVVIVVLSTGILFALNNLYINSNYFQMGRIRSILLGVEERGDSIRLDMLERSIQGFLSDPFFGWGTSNFESNEYHVSHNTYAQLIYEHGLVGLIIVAGFIYILFARTSVLLTEEKSQLVRLSAKMTILIYLGLINVFETIQLHLFACILIVPWGIRKIERS